MVKKLLAVGCSYTADAYPFPVWPKLLAEKFNMKCINLGQCGSGNEAIYSKTLDTLVTEKNLGLIVVMWTEFQRLDFCNDGKWETLHFKVDGKEKNPAPWRNTVMNTLTENGFDDIVYQTERSIRLFYSLQQIMKLPEYNNIPFYQLVGTSNVIRSRKYIVAETIIDSPYLTKIDERSFLGWPMVPELGGWNIDTWIDKVSSVKRGQYSDLRISKDDFHPNKKGHEKIAELLYNEVINDPLIRVKR